MYLRDTIPLELSIQNGKFDPSCALCQRLNIGVRLHS